MTGTALLALYGLDVLPRSAVTVAGAEVGLVRSEAALRPAVLDRSGSPVFTRFEGERRSYGGRALLLGPTSASNLDVLRALLTWLRPRTLDLETSVGFGDRLGLATPGHIRALQDLGLGLHRSSPNNRSER